MKVNNLFLGIILSAITFISCNQDDISESENFEQTNIQSSARIEEGVIPFTVENVKKVENLEILTTGFW